MLIKICGMKEPGNVKEVAALHPDMLGFIFYKASPRYAGDLSPRALERLPAAIGKVGVFVNAETGFIENIVRRYKMDTIQLHGDEPPEMPTDGASTAVFSETGASEALASGCASAGTSASVALADSAVAARFFLVRRFFSGAAGASLSGVTEKGGSMSSSTSAEPR